MAASLNWNCRRRISSRKRRFVFQSAETEGTSSLRSPLFVRINHLNLYRIGFLCWSGAHPGDVHIVRGSFAKIVTKISMSYPLRLFMSRPRVSGAQKHAVKPPVGFLSLGFSPESGNDRELRGHHFCGRGTFLGGPDGAMGIVDFSRGAISLQ